MAALPRGLRGVGGAVPARSIPKHVGRTYEAVIRVNSQSGKGGVAYIMETEHGFELPRRLQIEFSKTIQAVTEDTGTEITPAAMWDAFRAEYLPEPAPSSSLDHELTSTGRRRPAPASPPTCVVDGEPRTVTGAGNGPIAAFVDGAAPRARRRPRRGRLPRARARAGGRRHRGRLRRDGARPTGALRWGVGMHPNIITASLVAVLSGLARGKG